MRKQVIRELENAGVRLSEEVIRETDEAMRGFSQMLMNAAGMVFGAKEMNRGAEYANALLMTAGSGKYDEETGEWTPLSRDVYTLEIEAPEPERMYSLVLRGVEAIVEGVKFTRVEETCLDEADEPKEWYGMPSDGSVRVAFLCNGHPYEVKVARVGDWFNVEFLEYVESVLHSEGLEGKLYCIGREMDLAFLLVYGDLEKAQRLAELTGGHLAE